MTNLEDIDGTKKKTKWLPLVVAAIVAAVVILGVALGIGAAVGAFDSDEVNDNDGNGNQGDDNDNVDFCLDSGISDATVRAIIADNFDDLFDAGNNILRYDGLELLCLPENAFGNLNLVQGDLLNSEVDLLSFTDAQIGAIHPNAFPIRVLGEEVLVGINQLDFSRNSLSELPDDVFTNFFSLNDLFLDENDFVTLNNDILGIPSERLFTLTCNGCASLEAIPEVIRLTPNLGVLGTNDCVNLETIADGVFDTPERLFQWNFRNTPLAELSVTELEAITGLNEAVFFID